VFIDLKMRVFYKEICLGQMNICSPKVLWVSLCLFLSWIVDIDISVSILAIGCPIWNQISVDQHFNEEQKNV
jgi:hypothetical protein